MLEETEIVTPSCPAACFGNKPDQSWRYGIQTPLESQASFSAFDRDVDRVALGNKTSCLVTEAFNVLRFGTLLRVVSLEMRFFMYLGTLKTIVLIDHCYDEISHILIAGSERHKTYCLNKPTD
jgi:hypothetical protein